MLFNSLTFLYFFLPVTYLVFWRLRGRRARHVWLAVTGYVFYSFWNYKFCALMLLSTLVSYLAGLGLLRWRDPARRRACFLVPITVDLAVLGIFKYTNFLLDSVNDVAAWLGGQTLLPTFEIVLPVGISFYTFHTVTYIVDAYRGLITPTRSLAEFACYVSLFAQLVAGPIVRFRQIEEDLGNIDRAERTRDLNVAWSFFAIGMIKKVLLADTIGRVINPALADYQSLSTVGAWLCVLGFAYQVYFDFSGYSDMAVGLGYLFGLRLPQNFNSPYQAVSVPDLWRRWHISMSSFFRDYVYIPLGGSRVPRPLVFRNLMITMFLAGLWHGASWTYVLWGVYTGLLLCLHELIGDAWERLPLAVRRILTFLLFCLGLVFFRAESAGMALDLFGLMFAWTPGPAIVGAGTLAGLILAARVVTHLGRNTFEMDHRWGAPATAALTLLFGLCLVVLYGSVSTPFLYFQF